MATFTPTVFSVSRGGFDTAVLFNAAFQVNAPDPVEFTDDDGILSSSDLGATTVKVGDDSQGPITGIQFRDITFETGSGTVTFSVALIERADVADYLIVPIDRVTGQITDVPLELGEYRPGGTFTVQSVNLMPDDTIQNTAPTAVDDDETVAEDGSVTVDLLGNDTDPEEDGLTVTNVGDAANGTVALVDGAYVYTPNANFNGTDSFDYTISDGEFESTATVNVVVTSVNDAPILTDDTASTDEDTAVSIAVLGNDSDVDTDLAVANFSQGANGSVTRGEGGQLIYTPNADFSGDDEFAYTVFDGMTTVAATVFVTVDPVNDAPIAAEGSEAVNEDQSVVIDLSALVSDVDSSNLVIDAADPANGELVDNNDGTYTYTPDADYNGDDSFSYSVTDGELTDSASVTIAVAAVNDAPEADDDTASTDFETATTIDVLANDSDTEGDDLTIAGITGAAVGLVAISADGKSISYTPADGFSGQDSFGYILSDGTATDEAAVTVTVGEPGNRAPVAMDDTADVLEDGSVSIFAADNDEDADDDDDLFIADFSQGSNGSVGFDGEGGVLYTPNADFEGEDTFTYTVSDGELTDTATVTVTVNGVNDAPVANDADATTQEDTGTVINILALVSDIDSDALDLEVGDPSNGVIVDLGDGLYRYTPDADFNGSDSVTFTVSDGDLTDEGMINIFVEAVNDAPDAMDDGTSTAFETPTDINVLENDSDVEGDDLTITGITGNPDGEVVIAADGKSVTYTPSDGFSGDDSFGYVLSDGTATDEAQVTVTVEAQDELPPVAEDDSADTSEDTAVAIDVLDNDSDANGDELSIVDFTDGASGSVAENDAGELVYTPDADSNGEDSFTYTITDGTTEATATVTVNVIPENDAPVAEDDTASTDFETATSIEVLLNDTDVEADNLTITGITGAAVGLVEISADGKSIDYTPADGFSGQDSFGYILSDGTTTDEAAVTVTVGEADNGAPIAMNDTASTTEDNSVAIDVLGNDEDPDANDDVTIVSFGDGTNGSVEDDGEGQLVYTPNDDFNGEDSFTYTITDGALESTATVFVTVDPVNDAPETGDLGPFDVSEDDLTMTYDVLAVAADIDSSDLSITSASASWAGGDLILAISPAGVSFDPSQLGDLLDAGDTAVVSVSYTISDGEATDDGSFTINVEGADDDAGLNVIEGTDGNDLLQGTDGDDMLISLAGSYDRQMGGAGADTFVFGSESTNGARERDLIMDFEGGIDTICLETDDYGVRVLGTTGLITYGEDLIYVRGTFTQEELENGIQVGCFDDLIV